MYIYYEPVKNKIYLSDSYQGLFPQQLNGATDGRYHCSWFFTKKEYKFYFIGEA